MKKVITYGTYDLFHFGHVRLLERLSQLGDELIVGCSTDEFNALKGKTCVMTYAERIEVLKACRYVSKVIPEERWDQKREDILREGAHVFGMGDDWQGHFDELKDIAEVVYLPRTVGVSTTDLRVRIMSAKTT